MATQKALLTEGSVTRRLFALSLPMFIGLLAGMAYGIADSYWIGRLGSIQQSALTQIYQIDVFLIKLSLGLGIGITVIVSRLIGKGEWHKAQQFTLSALILGLCLASLIAVAGLFSINPLFSFLKVDAIVMNYVKQYMWIWYPSVIFMIAPVILNSTMRAAGNAMYPGILMLGGSLLNMILDPLFIFTFNMGVSGAAFATFICRFITFALALFFAIKINILDWKSFPLRKVPSLWGQIADVAIPTSLTQIIAPISSLFMIGFINSYGPYEAAGYGPAFRIEILFIAPLMALGAMMGPFTGQNLGAKKYDRIFEALKKSILFAALWGISVAVILYIIRKPLAPLFNDSKEAFWSFRFYLAITSWSVAAIGINAIWLQFLNATGRQRTGTIITLIQLFGITIPMAFIATSTQKHIAWVYVAILIGHYCGLALFSLFGLKRATELSGKDAPIIKLLSFSFLAFGLIVVMLRLLKDHLPFIV